MSLEARTFSNAEVSRLVRRQMIAWGVVAAVFCVIPSWMIFLKVPEFGEMYRGFGADLGATTQFVLRHRYLLLLAPAIVVGSLVVSVVKSGSEAIAWHGRIVWWFAALVTLSMIFNGFVIDALYAPIFKLGAVS